jgi:hypothetical protein
MAATSAEIQAKLDKLEINMDRLNNIVNGASTLDIAIDSGVVPSLAKFYATIGTTAGGYVTQAQAAATSASGYSTLASLWAESPNEIVPGQRSAKYWAGVATGAVAGVASFNGRSGNVVPVSGDYTTTTVTRGAGTLESSLVTIEGNITTNGNLATVNAASVDMAHRNISILALDMADIKGIRNGMAGGIADPYDSEDGINLGTVNNGIDFDTITCLHFDGVNGKKSIIDSGFGINHGINIPTWECWGTATITTAQSKFGGSCLSVGGNGGPYAADGNSWFAFGTGDFTIDCWFRRAAVGVQDTIYESRIGSGTPNPNFAWYVSNANFLSYSTNASTSIAGTTLITANTWYHMAVVRSGNVTKMYLNGVQEGSTFTDNMNVIAVANRPLIGRNYNATGSQMFLDEFRISRVARWTSNFTPPAAPYAVYTGTTTANQIYDSANDYYFPKSAGTKVLSVAAGISNAASTRYSLRTIIDGTGILSIGTAFRVKLTTGPAGAGVIDNVFFGRKAATGNVWDMDTVSSTPVRVTFNGGANNVTIPASSSVWSDWITFSMGADHVIAFDTPVSNYLPSISDIGASYASYFKASVTEAGTPVVTGYTAATANTRYFVTELEVRNNNINYADLTLESVPVTALSVPTSSRLSIQVTGSATLTPNTDIIGQVSRDGGTTWTSVTLALTENYNGIRQFEGTASITSQPSGTSMKYRVQILNDKNALISGAVQQWS